MTTIQIGNEANVKDIAQEFRDILAKISTYTTNEASYDSAIQEFETELAEEISLQRILDENDASNFTAIRDALQAFQEKNDIQTKFARLQELHASIQAVVQDNNQKLRGHTEVVEFVAAINAEQNLPAAEGIPTLIQDIRNFLISEGRTGDNTPCTVFSNFVPTRHSETPGAFTAMYLDGETWLSLEAWNVPSGWTHMTDNRYRTLMFWVKKDMNEPVNDCGIFGWGTMSVDCGGFGVVLQDGDAKATVGGVVSRPFAASNLDDGLWHHIVIENVNGKIIQYLDGIHVGEHLLGSITTSFQPGNSGVYLGGAPDDPTLGFGTSGGKFFKGYIAEIGIHKRQIFDLIDRGRLTDLIDAVNWGGGLGDGNLGSYLGHDLVAYYNFKDGHLDEKVNGGNELTLRAGTIDLVSTNLRNL